MECHTTLERVVAQRAKEKSRKGSDCSPSVVNNESFGGYFKWCWRIGHKEAQCWLKQEYMKSNTSQDPLKRDIREWSNTSETGQGQSQPKGRSKGKGKGKKKHPRKGNHSQEKAGSPNEDGQRTIGDFGIKRQGVEFVGDVQENDDFESPFGSSSLCFLRSEVQQCFNGSDRTAEFVDESLWWEWGASGHSWKIQSTGEVLFAIGCRDDRPIVDSGSVVSKCPVDHATSVPTEKVQYSMNWSVYWVNLCNITASSVMFFSPTDLEAAWMSILMSLTRNVQFCLCTMAAAVARWSCSLQMERVK